jgi:hypothetical protein
MRSDEPTSLELELARLFQASEGAAERRQQLMAFRFYLHRVINLTLPSLSSAPSNLTERVRPKVRMRERPGAASP